MTIPEILRIIKEIGLQRILKIVSNISGFCLPFILWIVIFQLVGRTFFIIEFAVLGILYTVFGATILLFQLHNISSYPFQTMKQIEHAKNIFDNPADSTNEEKYIAECERFIFPYLYRTPLLSSGLNAFIQTRIWKLILIELPILYIAYSIMTLLVFYQNSINAIYSLLISNFYVLQPISQLIPTTTQDWIILLFVFWIGSLYMDLYIRSRILKNRLALIPSYCFHQLNIQFRIILLIHYVLNIPITIRKHRLVCQYLPFVDPQSLPTIVQRAVENVEGKSCNMTMWIKEVREEKDIESLKNMLLKDPKVTRIQKFFVRQCKPKDALSRIMLAQPVLYLGTEDNRCVFLGEISYNLQERVRVATFYFSTIYIKREFKLILQKEIEKQRELQNKLPIPLEKIIESIERMKDER